jgi:hypothetical protein
MCRKDATVKDLHLKRGVLSLRRWLPDLLYYQWVAVCNEILKSDLKSEADSHVWKCGSGKFSVRSLYDHLGRVDNANSFVRIWKAKIPYKIKIFLWLVENGAILTKDNMNKRK